jgi:putative spermidine/putrescine transport system substrate-binding protein
MVKILFIILNNLKMASKHPIKHSFNLLLILVFLTGCNRNSYFETIDYSKLVVLAQKEGKINSAGMPDTWANWGATWNELSLFYNLNHADVDMRSGQVLEGFAEGNYDIGDVGLSYAIEARNQGLLAGYKTSYWDEIPSWAKDDSGDYLVSFTGTMSLLINNSVLTTEEAPKSFADIKNGSYKVAISNVLTGYTGQFAVYAATIALGGSADNLDPGIQFFKDLAKGGRLVGKTSGYDDFIASGAGVIFKWDFEALNFRDQGAALTTPVSLSACIPSDGSVTSGYCTIINKLAKDPYSAMLTREYALSDAGQLNFAKGYATPIRSVRLPSDLENKRIPHSQYNQTQIDNGGKFTVELSTKISSLWSKEVSPYLALEEEATEII